MNVLSPSELRIYKAGYRRFKWHDAERDRPVWGDLWYPADAAVTEQPLSYGLGEGSVSAGAPLAAIGAPFALVVLSHGASGSAPAYGWIAEYLARRGVLVLGVSHFGESFIYGPQTVDPAAVTHLWLRPRDCSFALTQLLASAEFAPAIAGDRIGALGHSSGGATVIALGGASFDPAALFAYCRSDAARGDRGCQYGGSGAGATVAAPAMPAAATQSYHDPRIKAIVALDPAAGPGYSAAALQQVNLRVLVIGSVYNDFLLFAHHAGHYAARLPRATLIKLDRGEGHFIYLNTCSLELMANGVLLCEDRPGVDRAAVHAEIAPRIHEFLARHLSPNLSPNLAPNLAPAGTARP